MEKNDLCFIKEQYFLEHPRLLKMLDPGNTQKQSKRSYICVRVVYESQPWYLPLRNNLGDAVRKFGRIGHSVPSASRPNAGIDYRHALLIRDTKYIEIQNPIKLPASQYNRICADYDTIQSEFELYLKGFVKAVLKDRVSREPLYREASLINFADELCAK